MDPGQHRQNTFPDLDSAGTDLDPKYLTPSFAIILMGKRELIALLNLSSWCLVMVEQLFLAVPRGCLQFVIVVFPDHTHLLFFGSDVHEKNRKG